MRLRMPGSAYRVLTGGASPSALREVSEPADRVRQPVIEADDDSRVAGRHTTRGRAEPASGEETQVIAAT